MDKSTNVEEDKKLVARMSLNDNKAGMQGLDKEKINKIIMENTVGSRFYKNEQKRDLQVQEKIRKMKKQLESFTIQQKTEALKKADDIIRSIELNRDLTRTIVHVDMDAFYASVEERDRPELKEKPMAVGGMDMLSTSNYVARRYGVRAAMPGFIAMKLCPDLTIVPLNFAKYKEVSGECQEIYKDYDCNFSAMSLDEAYLDITEHLEKRILFTEAERTYSFNEKLVPQNDDKTKLGCSPTSKVFGFSAEEVTQEIRFRIHQKTLLTASAGIGPNTMLAKIGSDLNKPNGQTFFKPDRESIMDFVKSLSIRKVSGIGKVSEQLLSALDIKTCGDLFEHRANLVLLFSAISCSFFFRTALGCSSTSLDTESERKSISNERTFKPISNPDELFEKLDGLCKMLAEDLKKHNSQGKTVTLKTKTIDFESHTRSRSSITVMSKFDEIIPMAKELLKQEMKQAKGKLALRLMGVGMSKLEPLTSGQQISIKKFFKDGPKCSFEHPGAHIEPEVRLEPELQPGLQDDSRDGSSNLHSNHSIQDSKSCALLSEEILSVNDTSKVFKDTLPDQNISALPSPKNSNIQCSEPTSTNNTLLYSEQDSSCPQPSKDMLCPVCNVVYSTDNYSLAEFNLHIDSCLSRQEIKDILKKEKGNLNNNLLPRSHTEGRNPAKRRRISKDKFHKIETFFT